VRQFVNVDLNSYEDLTLVYTLFDFIDHTALTVKRPGMGLVSLMS
jgi:hypothetical protein